MPHVIARYLTYQPRAVVTILHVYTFLFICGCVVNDAYCGLTVSYTVAAPKRGTLMYGG